MFKTNRTYNLSQGVKSKSLAVINKSDGGISVLMHRTIVVDQSPTQVIINTGGWDTVSTRITINTALLQLGLNYLLFRKKK